MGDGAKDKSPGVYPRGGSRSPDGGANLNGPEGVWIESVTGLKLRSPENAMAVTISGDAKKFIVLRLPSFLALKFRLNDVRIALSSPFFSSRFHCPIHGPQALASTVAPTSSKVDCNPSLSIVARMSSDPGVTRNGTLDLSPAALACSAMDATRDMSSYDELVHEPMSAEERVVGYLFSFKNDPKAESGVARSGVKGPFK